MSDHLDVPLQHLMHHRAWLRALAARLVGPGLADDLAQETWLAALRRPPDPARPARPWLAAVARRLARRVRGSGPGAGEPSGEPASPAPSSSELLLRLETEARLARAVAALDEPFRRTVLLRYHEGLSAAEIARRDGVPAGTVRWRLKRGLDALRARLDRDFGDRRSWSALVAGLAGLEAAGAGVASLAWKAAAAAALALAVGGGAAWRARAAEPEGGRSVPARAAAAEVVKTPAQGFEPSDGADRLHAPRSRDARVAVAAPADAETGPTVRLEVVHPDGTPAAGLDVAVRTASPGEEPAVATTDASGFVAFDLEQRGPVEVAIRRIFAPTYVVALEPDARTRRIELPAGAVVAGRVVIDGAPPRSPLLLEAFESEGLGGGIFAGTWRPSFWFSGREPLHASTDAEGRFAFLGLRAGWHGTLRLPRGHALRGARPVSPSAMHGAEVFVREPADDLLLVVERFPSVRGTIVEADGVTPVEDARVRARVLWTDPPGAASVVGAQPDPDTGRFEIFYEDREPAAIELVYSGPSGRGETARALTAAELGGDGDLGLLRLPPARAVTLVFVDEGGAPIPGARVEHIEEVSGPDGRLRVATLEAGAATVRAGAFGYVPSTVDVPARAEELEVVLQRANALAIALLDVEGRPLAQAEVALSAAGEESFFVSSTSYGPDPLSADGHAGRHAMTTFRDGFTASFRTDRAGRFSTGPLRTDRPLRATFADALDVVLVEEEIPPLGPRETRAVTLRVPVALSDLAVRVVDQDGAPLRDASVRVTPAGRPARRGGASTNGEGRARCTRISAPHVDLLVEKEGYLPAAASSVPVGGGERVFVLERGLDVAVHVVDANGRAVGGGRIELGSEDDVAGENAPGRFDLRGLSDAPVEIVLSLAGRRYSRVHDPRVPEVVFEVPVHGAVEIAWSGGEADALLELRPEDPTLERLTASPVRHAPTCTIAPVLPGTYVVHVRAREDGERELAEPVRVDVVAGETAKVVLR